MSASSRSDIGAVSTGPAAAGTTAAGTGAGTTSGATTSAGPTAAGDVADGESDWLKMSVTAAMPMAVIARSASVSIHRFGWCGPTV